jgi:Flp pilus assembly protein TadD
MAAQEVHPLRGEIESQTPVDYSMLTVKLYRNAGDTPEVAHVEHDGHFVFYGLKAGPYTLRVMNAQQEEIVSDQVLVGFGAPVTLHLPEQSKNTPTGQTISAARLLHPPDKHALRDAVRAQHFAESGQHERAAEELQKAVSEDPNFADAYNNLGAQYVKIGRFEDAAGAFRRAAELDPSVALPRVNLAVVLGKTGHLDEAEQWARSAVHIDSTNATAQHVLGLIVAAKAGR